MFSKLGFKFNFFNRMDKTGQAETLTILQACNIAARLTLIYYIYSCLRVANEILHCECGCFAKLVKLCRLFGEVNAFHVSALILYVWYYLYLLIIQYLYNLLYILLAP